MKWLVLVCLVEVSLAFPSPIRSKEEVEELRRYLLSTKQDANITLEEAMARNPVGSTWENSGKFQGDILLQDEEIEEMISEYAGEPQHGRNGLSAARHRWPGGVIYYEIAANTFNNAQLNMIQTGLNFFHERTCTRWVRRTNQRDYVFITEMRFKAIHMHQTYNRYDWIWINWQNIIRGYEFAFEAFSNQVVTMLGLPYEYGSNMHYGAWAFSSNGQPTIGARFSGGEHMGQLNYISGFDIWRLARMYNCPGAWSVEVRPEDINKPYDEDFDRRLKEAAAREIRERAEILDRALEEKEKEQESHVSVAEAA